MPGDRILQVNEYSLKNVASIAEAIEIVRKPLSLNEKVVRLLVAKPVPLVIPFADCDSNEYY